MKKLFTSDKFFLAMVLCAVTGLIFCSIECILPFYEDYQSAITFIAIAICEIVLYASYQHHEKNVMKGILGALLMALFLCSVSWINSATLLDRVFGMPCVS